MLVCKWFVGACKPSLWSREVSCPEVIQSRFLISFLAGKLSTNLCLWRKHVSDIHPILLIFLPLHAGLQNELTTARFENIGFPPTADHNVIEFFVRPNVKGTFKPGGKAAHWTIYIGLEIFDA